MVVISLVGVDLPCGCLRGCWTVVLNVVRDVTSLVCNLVDTGRRFASIGRRLRCDTAVTLWVPVVVLFDLQWCVCLYEEGVVPGTGGPEKRAIADFAGEPVVGIDPTFCVGPAFSFQVVFVYYGHWSQPGRFPPIHRFFLAGLSFFCG